MSEQTSADLPPNYHGMKCESIGALTGSYLPLIDKVCR